MELVTTQVPTTRIPLRQLAVLAILAALLVAALAVYVGSHQQRVAPPFGLAGNGLIADTKDGDIYTVDPSTSKTTLLVGGATQDEWVDFTKDGSRAIFFRVDPNGATKDFGWFGTVPVAGGAPTMIEALRVSRWDWVEPGPDGQTLAVLSRVNGPVRVSLVNIDGSGLKTFDNVEAADFGGIGFRAPDGRELAFFATAPGGGHRLVALDIQTGAVKTIVSSTATADLCANVSVSPDGSRIAYGLCYVDGRATVRVVDFDGSNDGGIGRPRTNWELWPQWSPDGRHLLVERANDASRVQPVVIDTIDGTEVGIGASISKNGAGKMWSPDGRYILAQRTGDDGTQFQQELWDTTTGAVSTVSWPSTSAPAWQRIAR